MGRASEGLLCATWTEVTRPGAKAFQSSRARSSRKLTRHRPCSCAGRFEPARRGERLKEPRLHPDGHGRGECIRRHHAGVQAAYHGLIRNRRFPFCAPCKNGEYDNSAGLSRKRRHSTTPAIWSAPCAASRRRLVDSARRTRPQPTNTQAPQGADSGSRPIDHRKRRKSANTRSAGAIDIAARSRQGGLPCSITSARSLTGVAARPLPQRHVLKATPQRLAGARALARLESAVTPRPPDGDARRQSAKQATSVLIPRSRFALLRGISGL